MKQKISVAVVLLMLIQASSALAQAPTCQTDFKWRDAYFVQRTTSRDGLTVKVNIEKFSNLSVTNIDADIGHYSIIKIPAVSGKPAITFMLGDGEAVPSEFSEISMIAEPPMADGTWPRFRAPCALENRVTLEFNEQDLYLGNKKVQPIQLRGKLERQDSHIIYSVEFYHGLQSSIVGRWEGDLRYSSHLAAFDIGTDIRGWRIFLDDKFLERLPVDRAVSLSSALERTREIKR